LKFDHDDLDHLRRGADAAERGGVGEEGMKGRLRRILFVSRAGGSILNAAVHQKLIGEEASLFFHTP
jgi:hypothetical protein